MLTLRRLSQKIKDTNKVVTTCIQHAVWLNQNSSKKELTPQRQARLTGGTGLYMNYSIIFTEISFYPETSILLQII